MGRFATIIIIFLLLEGGCSTPRATTERPAARGYITSFPERDTHQDLTRLFRSIKRITSTVFYNSYEFKASPAMYDGNIPEDQARTLAVRESHIHNSTAGTALVLSNTRNRLLLLTCAHIITFPDTIVQYYPTNDPNGQKPVRLMAYKVRQINLLIDNEELGRFDVVAEDRHKDLALLALDAPVQNSRNILPFDFPVGNIQDLKLGSFTYILGYPKGYQMVAHAIVGGITRGEHGSFLIDAPFNHGFSGGVVMALRGAAEKLELVGISNSSSATTTRVLAPDKQSISDDDVDDLYTGPIILKQQSSIDYGITRVIPVNVVREFLIENREPLRRYGFRIPRRMLQ